ncbi:MAG TPA: cell division topological specificity factor MinE [Stellaceae bacterium]|nr:cell division topological specificity factor MinE [Stellaceae bacterium]
MAFFRALFQPKRTSAQVAKERLKIVLAHERASSRAPDFLPNLQKELLAVVGRYVEISDDGIRVTLGSSGDTSLLEINIEIEGGNLKKSGPSGPALSPAV